MRPYYNYQEPGYRQMRLGFGLTRAVKMLILANFVCLVVFLIVGARSKALYRTGLRIFGVYPHYFLRGYVWQPVTYMFVHSGIGHFFWNMLLLFFFAGEVERVMGTRKFVGFYFASGITAGMCAMFTWSLPTIGASGACLAVLIAFALYFPDALVVLFFVIPVKVKYLAMFVGGLTVLSLLAGTDPEVSHWGHLGGILYALFYIKVWPGLRLRLPRFSFGGQRSTGAKFHPPKHTPMSDLEVRDKMDEILLKVHDQGIQSLSRGERKFLQEMSRRYRH